MTKLMFLTTIIAFITVLISGLTMGIVYGQFTTPNMKYTDTCEGYRAYTDWKGITRYEANTNITLIEERINDLQLGQKPGTTGPVSEAELKCLQGLRSSIHEEISKILGPADIQEMIEDNNRMLELFHK